MATLPFAPLPAATDTDRRALAVFLNSRATEVSRRAAAVTLDLIARSFGCGCRETCAWTALDYEHAMYLRRSLSEGRQPETVNVYLSTLRGLARYAIDAGIGDEGRWLRVLKIKALPCVTDEEPGRAFTAEEMAAMLAVCASDPSPDRGTRDRFILQLMWGTGLRVSTVAALQWPDSFIEGRALAIRTKGGKRYVMPLDASLMEALSVYLAVRGEQAGPLLVRVSGGRLPHRALTSALSAYGIYEVIVRVSTAAGLERATPHDFRRTFATDLIGMGVDLVTVQKLMGHSRIATTAAYDRAPYSRMEDAVKLRPLPGAKGSDDGRGNDGNGAADSSGDEGGGI